MKITEKFYPAVEAIVDSLLTTKAVNQASSYADDGNASAKPKEKHPNKQGSKVFLAQIGRRSPQKSLGAIGTLITTATPVPVALASRKPTAKQAARLVAKDINSVLENKMEKEIDALNLVAFQAAARGKLIRGSANSVGFNELTRPKDSGILATIYAKYQPRPGTGVTKILPLPKKIRPNEQMTGATKYVSHSDEKYVALTRNKVISKNMPSKAEARKQYLRQMELLEVIGNPSHIIPQIQVTEERFIARNAGNDLGSLIRAGKSFSISAFMPILQEMKFAHTKGVVFGDRKPENMMMEDDEACFIDLDTMEEMGKYDETKITARTLGFFDLSTYSLPNKYGKINDDYAMLVSLVEATEGEQAQFDRRGKINQSQMASWIEEHASSRENEMALNLLYSSPVEYFKKYGNNKHLCDMLVSYSA